MSGAGQEHAGDVMLGHTTPPQTAAEAAALLRKVANHRDEYSKDGDSNDLYWSIAMLHVAADIIESGNIGGWVPSWRWDEYR